MSNTVIQVGKLKLEQRSPLARNIVLGRKARGWSQLDLAHKVGVHKNIINKIETDKGEGELATRQAIADALGCTLADLYSDPGLEASGARTGQPAPRTVGEMTPSELAELLKDHLITGARREYSSEDLEILTLVRKAGARNRRVIVDFLKALPAPRDRQARPSRTRAK